MDNSDWMAGNAAPSKIPVKNLIINLYIQYKDIYIYHTVHENLRQYME